MVDFLLLMENYKGSYTKALKANPHLRFLAYDECAKELFSKFIYYGDAYKDALTKEGFSAEQIIPECAPLQFKWARENSMRFSPSWIYKAPFRWWWTRILKTSQPKDRIKSHIITEQVKKLRPKILWVFSGVHVTRDMIKEWRPYVGHIMLWWSCPLCINFPYDSFDAIFSCIPLLVKRFKTQGIKAYHLPHSFDPRILSHVKHTGKRILNIAFVGTSDPVHKKRISFMDRLSRYLKVDFYGPSVDSFPEDSPMRANWHGEVWGKDLYSVYGSYLFAIHTNIDVAEKQASAKRLFEITGMGTCLLTDSTDHLEDLFEPEKEAVVYSTPEECIDKVKYLLAHPQEAMKIGKRAQERALKNHTYKERIKQLLKYLTDLGFLPPSTSALS